MTQEPIANQVILVVFPLGEDRTSLEDILGNSTWQLRFTHTLAETQAALGTDRIAVVLSERRLSDGHCWKDVLDHLQDMPHPAPLIVADRLADDALWAEVLNLGGYDVLATPFHAKEVLHAVTAAWRYSVAHRDRAARHRRPSGSARIETSSGEKTRATFGAG